MTVSAAAVQTDQEGMLCYCSHITAAQFSTYAAGRTFEQALEASGVGAKCTACLLDAEYLFVNASGSQLKAKQTTTVANSPQLSWRRKLWNLVDSFAPMAPFPLGEYSPILRGRNVETSIFVANDHLMYDRELAAPALQLEWSIYNSAGREVNKGRRTVNVCECIQIPASTFLPLPEDGRLTLGSIRLKRRFASPGVRGTTRPQIVLKAKDACCAVHVQGPNAPGRREFNLLARGGSERILLSVINPGNKDLRVSASADVLDGQSLKSVWQSGEVTILSNNTHLFELEVAESHDMYGNSCQAFLNWTCDGMHKAHIICASKSLDQFSIDHP